jgi:hypothetical protein
MNFWRLGRLGGGEKIQKNCGGSIQHMRQMETVIILDFEGMQVPLLLLIKQAPARCSKNLSNQKTGSLSEPSIQLISLIYHLRIRGADHALS